MTTFYPEHIATPDGILHAMACGNPEHPVLLCMHGFPDQPLSFEPLLRELSAAGLYAVAPWLRGYAPSQGGEHVDPDTLSNDILTWKQVLSPKKPIFLVGHDWGAVHSYLALQQHPEAFRRAVTMAVPHPVAFVRNFMRYPYQLSRSWYMLFFQLPWIADWSVEHDDFALVQWLWRTWSPGFDPGTTYWETLKACLATSMPAPINFYREAFRHPRDAQQQLKTMALPENRIQVPTLYLHGSQDGCVHPNLMLDQERYFAAEFASEQLAGVGHFLHLEQPEVVAKKIRSWLLK
jgi:pimeloyl-ACP methyl ester carboxylesterase